MKKSETEKYVAQLESLRSLRRERAESAMARAQDVVRWSTLIAEDEDLLAQKSFDRYRQSQARVDSEIQGGGRSVDQIRQLIVEVERSGRIAQEIQGSADLSWRQQAEARQVADEARLAAQQAAAAHERVLEWKRSA